MKVVSLFCTNCGAAAKIDPQQKVGFCSYCGSQLLLDDEKQRIELSGNVSVDGMLTLEKQLKSAEMLCKLGQYHKANNILEKLTHEYPEDYRVWWLGAYESMAEPYDINKALYGENNQQHFSYASYKKINQRINGPIENIRNALELAPEGQKKKLGIAAAKWVASFVPYFDWAEERTSIFFEYIEIYKRACKDSEQEFIQGKARRSRNKALAYIAPVVVFLLVLMLSSVLKLNGSMYVGLFFLFILIWLISCSWANKSPIAENSWSWYRSSHLKRNLPISEEQYRNIFEGSISEVAINGETFLDVNFNTPSTEYLVSRSEEIKNIARQFLATQ